MKKCTLFYPDTRASQRNSVVADLQIIPGSTCIVRLALETIRHSWTSLSGLQRSSGPASTAQHSHLSLILCLSWP